MRLSTHLDSEALAKLAAFKNEQTRAEAPAPKLAPTAGPASMMSAVAAASAAQPRVELPKPPTQLKKTPRQHFIPRRISRAAVVPAGSPAALDFEKKFEQSPTQFIALRHVRRELGVSSPEIHELAEFNSVQIFERGREFYIYRSDLKFIERAHQRRGGLVSLRTVGGSFNLAIKKVSTTCTNLGIHSVIGPDGDKWISAPDYVRLRKHLQKKSAPANKHAKKEKLRAESKTKRAKKTMPEGLPLPHYDRGFGGSRKEIGFNRPGRGVRPGTFISVVTGGLPTLGRGHK